MKIITPVLLILFFATHAQAEKSINPISVIDCIDGPSSINNIVEPLNENTRTYANGSIRVIHLDTGGEPACCSSYLAILSPNPKDELSGRQCKLLTSNSDGWGFMSVAFDKIRSSYNPIKGLLLSVPVLLYGDGSNSIKNMINVRINQTSGSIEVEH